MAEIDLTGEWISKYVYGEDRSSTHTVVFEEVVGLVVGNSVEDPSGSQLNLLLEFDEDNVLTGHWEEVTSPEGEYGGAKFYGGVQFILNEGLNAAQGKWVGFNSTKNRVNTGDWHLIKKPNDQ